MGSTGIATCPRRQYPGALGIYAAVYMFRRGTVTRNRPDISAVTRPGPHPGPERPAPGYQVQGGAASPILLARQWSCGGSRLGDVGRFLVVGA